MEGREREGVRGMTGWSEGGMEGSKGGKSFFFMVHSYHSSPLLEANDPSPL